MKSFTFNYPEGDFQFHFTPLIGIDIVMWLVQTIPMNKLSNIEKKILTDSKENSKDRIRGRRKTKVSRLKAGSPVSYLEVLVLRRYPPRVVSNRNWTGRVAAACGRDESGVVGLVLWDEQIEQVATGDIVQITDGWCKQRLGERVVSTGRNGTLRVIE